MATYTSLQLSGAGTIGENLSGTKTFTFYNAAGSGSAYFTLEAIRTSDGFYNYSSPVISSGSFSVSASMLPGFITSSNVFSLSIPPATSSFTFAPVSAITGSSYYLRGEGQISLIIS